MRELKRASPSLGNWAVVLGGAVALTAIVTNIEFNLLESNFYDLRMTQGAAHAPSSDIIIVTLDNKTASELAEVPPLTLDIHTRFLEALEEAQPRAVGYLIDMNRVAQVNPELFHGEWGQRFVEAVQRLESKGTAFVLGTPFEVTGEIAPPFPLTSLSHSVAQIHQEGNALTEDKVTRRALIHLAGKPTFHLDLARQMRAVPQDFAPKGSFKVRETDAEYFYFRYHGNTTQSPYERVSYLDILNGSVGAVRLRGKTLLVSTLVKEDIGDFAYTPFSKDSFVNPRVVVHANILDSLIRDDGIARANEWAGIAVTFLLIALVIGWVLISTPVNGVLATLGLALLFCAVAQVLFNSPGLWIRASQPLVGIFLAYYLVVPYRLIREYKQRFEYQRKNQLMVQVEELKSNFLNLVTHDLKTPVARIQGLAEVLVRKANDRLVDKDRETISHIMGATEELNRFITSILELNKVDSNRLSLNKEARDVNQLIERCVEGFKPLSRSKGVKIHCNLEPLFPIRVDHALISKVINNLIDNAIKYSTQGSEVFIESKEQGDNIVISVKDRGIGLSEDELEQLFTRFYRAKNKTTAEVAGTGLGLYLTRYFVEAHHGEVQVESRLGEGTIFRIILPLNDPDAQTGSNDSPKGLTRARKFLTAFKEKKNV